MCYKTSFSKKLWFITYFKELNQTLHVHCAVYIHTQKRKCQYFIYIKLSRKRSINTIFVYVSYILSGIILRLIKMKNKRFIFHPINFVNFVWFLLLNFSQTWCIFVYIIYTLNNVLSWLLFETFHTCLSIHAYFIAFAHESLQDRLR